MKKQKMKPVTRWLVIYDKGRPSEHPGMTLFRTRLQVRNYAQSLGMGGIRIARVEIREVKP